jgi:antitoxin component of RelBE/YafQ-DinJ toxin-antitoxin module
MDTKSMTHSLNDDLVRARVSKKLKEQFTATAKEQGRSPSEALREAMAEWVSRTRLAA